MGKDKYIKSMKDYFGDDTRRIKHALKVLNFSEEIISGENIRNEKMEKIIIITAILHDIGIKNAERKYNSSAGRYQEIEGPPVAREIMMKHNEDPEIIKRVLYIIGGHHTASKIDEIDFQIIWESDLLVNIEEDELYKDTDNIRNIIAKNFKTVTGIKIAKKLYTV